MSDFELHRLKLSRRSFLGRHRPAWARWRWRRCCKMAHSPPPMRPTRASSTAGPASINPLHFAPKAKRVIWLYMAGGPSHLETFDYKPKLAEMHGQPMPESFTKGQPIAQLQGAEAQVLRPAASRSRSAASRARRSARSSRTSARSPTRSASSARCRPRRSTTTRPTRS